MNIILIIRRILAMPFGIIGGIFLYLFEYISGDYIELIEWSSDKRKRYIKIK